MKKPPPPVRHCPFCKARANYCHAENDNTGMVYECRHCPVLVFLHYSQDKEYKDRLEKAEFAIDKQGHLYTWTDNYVKGSSYITDLDVSLFSLQNKSSILIAFPKLMNVTPTNVREKFGFYMIFL